MTRRQFGIDGLVKIARTHAIHFVPLHHEAVAGRHRGRRLKDIMPLAVTSGILVQDGERLGLRILPEFHNLGHARTCAVMHPAGGWIFARMIIVVIFKRRLEQDDITQITGRL